MSLTYVCADIANLEVTKRYKRASSSSGHLDGLVFQSDAGRCLFINIGVTESPICMTSDALDM